MQARPVKILYYDDQSRFRDAFTDRHRGRFRIRTAEDVSDVLSTLRGCTPQEFPDLLLLDLYHDIDSSLEDRKGRVKKAEAALEELDEALRQVRDHVNQAWAPAALEVLEEVRNEFPARRLPIMIYSQRGLFFLDEDQLSRVEDADAEWMLKGRGEHYEAHRIRRIVEEKPPKRIARDVTIAILSVLAGVLLSWMLRVLGGLM